MKDKTTRGRNQDRAKVASGEDYEVNYEKKKMGVGANKVKGRKGSLQELEKLRR